jgi:adenylate kinase family enzyme
MKARCLKRGEESGRGDDNAETVANRVDTYMEKTKPVIDHYEDKNMLYRVSALVHLLPPSY